MRSSRQIAYTRYCATFWVFLRPASHVKYLFITGLKSFGLRIKRFCHVQKLFFYTPALQMVRRLSSSNPGLLEPIPTKPGEDLPCSGTSASNAAKPIMVPTPLAVLIAWQLFEVAMDSCRRVSQARLPIPLMTMVCFSVWIERGGWFLWQPTSCQRRLQYHCSEPDIRLKSALILIKRSRSGCLVSGINTIGTPSYPPWRE